MDERIRLLKRRVSQDPNNVELLKDYIAALERGQVISKAPRIEPTDKSVPCFVCEKTIEILDLEHHSDISQLGSMCLNDGFSVTAHGGYGSRVLDFDSYVFALCDECAVRHSHKALYSRDEQIEQQIERRVIRSARTEYEEWFSKLEVSPRHLENGKPDDYLNTVSKYFEEDV